MTIFIVKKLTEKADKNKGLTRLRRAKTLAIEDLYVYISNRSKCRLDVSLHIAKKALETFQNKLQNNSMGSDIQSPVLSTNAISLIDGIKGQIPPEIKNEKTNTNPFFALRTSELQYIPCNNVLLTE